MKNIDLFDNHFRYQLTKEECDNILKVIEGLESKNIYSDNCMQNLRIKLEVIKANIDEGGD